MVKLPSIPTLDLPTPASIISSGSTTQQAKTLPKQVTVFEDDEAETATEQSPFPPPSSFPTTATTTMQDKRPFNPLQPLTLGVITGLTATPCSGPVLASILAQVSTAPLYDTVLQLGTFTLGYTSLLTASVVSGRAVIKDLPKEGEKYVELALGGVVMAMGATKVLEGAVGDPGIRGMEYFGLF